VIAIKDTALAKNVYGKETIIGDEWIKGIEAGQKSLGVVVLSVTLGKPCSDIRYETSIDKGKLYVKIWDKVPQLARTLSQDTPKASSSPVAAPTPAPQQARDSVLRGWIEDLLDVESKVGAPDTDLFHSAARHYKMYQWDNAIETLREMIESYPRSRHLERTYFLLAASIKRKSEKEASKPSIRLIRHFQEAIRRFPKSDYVPHATVSIGNCYLELDNYHEALGHYNLVLKNHQRHPAAGEALFQRGTLFVLTDKPQEAIRSFEEVEKHHSKAQFAMRAKMELVKTLFHTKSFKRSLRVLKQITTKKADEIYKNREILLYTGYNYYELGQMPQARDVLSKVLNYYPETESNHLVLARIADTYREEGIEDKAYKLYNLIMNTYPDSEGSIISLLRFAADGKQPGPKNLALQDSTIAFGGTPREIYEQIIEKYPDKALSQLAMLKLALLWQKKKDYEKSLAVLQEILTKHPETSLKNLEIKVVLQASLEAIFKREKQAGAAEKVVRTYELVKSSLSFENIPEFLLLVGDAYKEISLFEDALSVYKKASKFFTDHGQPAKLLLDLGECYYRLREFYAAERALKTFVARYPEHEEASKAHYWMGHISLERKEYDNALTSLELALQKGPDKYHKAKVLMAMADASKSKGDYEKVAGSLIEATTLLSHYQGGQGPVRF
jgi:TolA-binding protein